MKSKISFFNMGIYKSMLRRFWPLWALHFGAFLLIMPIITLVNSMGSYVDPEVVFTLAGGMIEASPAVAFAMAMLSAMAVYGFMYNSRSTGLIASLPVRREAVLGSAWLSAVSVVIASNIVIALLTFLCALPSGADTGDVFKTVFQWAAIYSLHFILFFGIASITAVMTGNSIAMPVLYIIFNFLAVGIELLVRTYCSMLVWGMSSVSIATDFLSPLVYMYSRDIIEAIYDVSASGIGYSMRMPVGIDYMQWTSSIIYCCVGIVLSVGALLMFRRRRMETAGDVVSIPCLKPIFKYGVAICTALCGGLLIYALFYGLFDYDDSSVANLIAMCLGMFIFGFIGYFGAKMLLNKSFHVFRGSWPGYIILCCLSIVFVLCCDLDVMNLGGYTPDISEVESIIVSNAGEIHDRETVEKYAALQQKIAAKREYYENYDDTTGEHFFTSVMFKYVLKDGKTVTRTYEIVWQDENYNEYYDLMNSPAVLKEQFSSKYPVDLEHTLGAYFYAYVGEFEGDINLTSRQAVDFYAALMADIEAGNKILFNNDADAYGSMTISLADTSDELSATDYYDIYVEISSSCTNCLSWIKDNLGIDLVKLYNDAVNDYGYSEYGDADDPAFAYATTHEG